MSARVFSILVLGALACSSTTAVELADGPPPGADVSQPYPIDRGDDGALTPGTYRGLWLRLVDTGEPTITPVDGVIGLVCVGMSNANQECSAFITHVQGAGADEVNPAVRVVNCAVGGHAIERWIDPSFDDTLWNACLTQKLAAAGVRPEQVRVLYHKAANQFTTSGGAPLPTYPAPGSDYERFVSNLSAFPARVREKFPSVQAVYSSSRSYGGYANTVARGEPLSYEEGHALNTWLAESAASQSIWFGWGAYLWAPDCATGVTNAGGLCYVRADYVEDGVHPSTSGRAKIALAMHQRLMLHRWYRR
jgi:hypothetical protein